MKHINIISAILLIGASVQLHAGTESDRNTYYGINAGNVDESQGSLNSFFGKSAGEVNLGWGNTFMGHLSGRKNTTGRRNTFIGSVSGPDNTIGEFNVFIGRASGSANTTGNSNTYIGRSSGFRNSTGNNNLFLGSEAGKFEIGSNRLYIETARFDDPDNKNPLIYGEFDNDLVRVNGTLETVWAGLNYNGDGLSKLLLLEADNKVSGLSSDVGFALRNARADFLWNFRTAEGVEGFIATKQGTGGAEFIIQNATDDYTNVILTLGNGAKNVSGVWINASSRALKENIKELSTQDALAAFHKLQPVTYNYKSDKQEQVVGFIAEDVPELVAIQSRDGLSSMDMVAVLTKVLQETRAELKAKDVEMEARQRAQDEKISKLESLLTNLSLGGSTANKEKVSLNIK